MEKPATLSLSAREEHWFFAFIGQTCRAYLSLCKPRVVALMLLTAVVGMQLAVPGFVPGRVLLFGLLGIGLMASGAAAVNHIIDKKFDALMKRTHLRPLPAKQVTPGKAGIFAFILAGMGMTLLVTQVNWLTAVLTLFTFIGYALIYSIYLKHATPQNIVIGGISGAMPPLLGWTAVTGQISAAPLLLVLIIFLWTPPHFWALAIYRRQDYAKVNIPMLPNTHGVAYTKLQILLYTILLSAGSLLPFATGVSGWIYLVMAVGLNGKFLQYAWRLYQKDDPAFAIRTFRFSITYLLMIFAALLIDHYFQQGIQSGRLT